MVKPDFKGKRVTVVGLARSGVAAARALEALGAHVTVTDKKPLDQLAAQVKALGNSGIAIEAGGHPDRIFSEADLIVLSPGVPKLPQLLQARQRGVTVISELELAWLLSASPYMGITGTNGKSTVTTLVGLMLAQGEEKSARRREHRQRPDRRPPAAHGAGLDRGGALEFSARGHRDLQAADSGDPECDAGPP